MTLFEQWKDLIENQTEETFPAISGKNTAVQKQKSTATSLDKPEEKMTGTLGELAANLWSRPCDTPSWDFWTASTAA